MVKSFTVDWLAQSHYDSQNAQDSNLLENILTHSKKPIPCTAQPRPTTCYDKKYLLAKSKSTKDYSDKQPSSNYPSKPTGFTSLVFSDNSGYSSGYESEASTVQGPSVEYGRDRRSAEKIHRRTRTKFTSEQICKLEKTFNKQKYLDPTERIKIAAKLNLSETQVRIWFQNRRMKLKREVQDWSPDQLDPALLFSMVLPPHLPGFQNHGQQLSLIPSIHSIHQNTMQQIPQQHPAHPIYCKML